jgi:hypothetical protein
VPTLLKLLRRLPVKADTEDIATFINRELLPFLQELKDSSQDESDQILNAEYHLASDDASLPNARTATSSDTILVDNSVAGDVSWTRAEITGEVSIPEGSNVATVPGFAAGFVVESATGLLSNEFVGTTSAQIAWDFTVPGVVTLSIVPGSVELEDIEDIPDETVLGNDTGSAGPPEAITVHQVLDWIDPSQGADLWTFDGVDDRIDYGNILALRKTHTSTYSLGIWANTTDTDGSLVGKNSSGPGTRGYQLEIVAGKVRFGIYEINAAAFIRVETNASYNDGVEHFVLVTYAGTATAAGVVIYIDGVSVGVTVLSDTLVTAADGGAPFSIGTANGATTRPLGPCTLRQLSVWNQALTALQVAEAYGSGTPPDLDLHSATAALELYTYLDSSDSLGASGFIDHSGSGIHGTAEGGGPTLSTGSTFVGQLAVRGDTEWESIRPETADYPLCSNGEGEKPSFRQLPLAGIATITGPTILGLTTGTGTIDTLTGGEAGHLIKKGVSISVTIAADQNNFSPANFATADHVFVSTSGGDYSITGFQSSVFAELAGTEFVLWCTSTGSITFVNNSGSSSAGNRLVTPTIAGSTFRISQNEAVKFRYVGTQWYALPHAPLLTGQLMGNRLQRGNVISATVSGTTHNWSPANLVTADAIEITLTGASTITGIDSSVFNVGGATASGREIILHNIDSTDTLTLPTNTGSSAGNCFHSRAPNRSVLVGPGQSALVRKEGSFWVPRLLDGALADDETLVNISGALGNAQPRALSLMAGGHLTYDSTNHRFDLANVSAGTQKGRQIDGGSGVVVDLTGAEQGENIRFNTIVVDSTSAGTLTSYSFAEPNNVLVFSGVTVELRSIDSSGTAAGRVIWLRHLGAGSTTITHQDAGSPVADRINTVSGQTLNLVGNEFAILIYLNSGWRVHSFSALAKTTSVGLVHPSTSLTMSGAELQRAALTGDVTAAVNSNATTIANDAVTNAKAADMAQSTIKLRAAGAGTGDPTDGTINQALLMLGTPRPGGKLIYTSAGWMYVDELLDEEFWTTDSGGGGSEFGNWNWAQPDGVTMIYTNRCRVEGHPGVVEQSVGATGTNRAMAETAQDSAGDRGEIFGEDIAFFRVVVRVTNPDARADPFLDARFGIGLALHDSSLGVGEVQGNSPNMSGEGVVLLKITTSGDWRYRVENGGVGGAAGTGVTPVVDEWDEVEFVQTSSGTWNIYVNGTLSVTGLTGGPTGTGLVPFIWCDNDSATETRYWQIDKFQIGIRFTSTRYT